MANVVFNQLSSWSRTIVLASLLIGSACSEPSETPPSPRPPHCRVPFVFFGLGSADLSQQDRQRLAQMFRRGDRDQVCNIDPDPTNRRVYHVIGYTDTSGSDVANEQLGLRRAQGVADYLVELGVAREYICVRLRGSKSPMILRDGLAPDNRYVEIVPTLMKPGREPCQ